MCVVCLCSTNLGWNSCTRVPEPWSVPIPEALARQIRSGSPASCSQILAQPLTSLLVSRITGVQQIRGMGEGRQSLAIPRGNKPSRKNAQLLIRACLACSPMHPCGMCHPRLLQAGSHLSGCLSQCLVPWLVSQWGGGSGER